MTGARKDRRVWCLALAALASVMACRSSDRITVWRHDGTVIVGHLERADAQVLTIRDESGVVHEVLRSTIATMATADERADEGAAAESASGAGATGARERGADALPPRGRRATLNAGTTLLVALEGELSTETTKRGDVVSAHVVRPLEEGGREIVPARALVEGTVTSVRRPGKDGTAARIALSFNTLRRDAADKPYALIADPITRDGVVTKPDVNKVVGALGAIVGRRPKPVAESLMLEAGAEFDVVLREPLTLELDDRGAARR